MEMRLNYPAGTVLPIGVYKERIFLKTDDSWDDITEKLSKEEQMTIKHVGVALGIYDGKGLNICRYFNYHVHSQYSILDAMNSVEEVAERSSGISALSEHGNMFSFLSWQKACEKYGKKSVFAFEAYVESVNQVIKEKGLERTLSETSEGIKEGRHLILIAKTDEGLRNLFALSTSAFKNIYRKPHVSLEDIKKYHEGIACTSACLSGEMARLLADDRYEEAKQVALFYKSVFGDDFYIEIQRHNIPIEEKVNLGLIELGRELGIKLIAANDSHWPDTDDAEAHDYLLCIRNKKTVKEPGHPTFDGDGYEYLSDTDMIKRFWDMPEVIRNGLKLASECNAKVETGVYHVPAFPLPPAFSSEEEYLRHLALKGFRERYGEGTEELKERLRYELSVILQMGYAGYFLIVWDYINWAKAQGILVGPGRGSAVGSMLAYCLKITELEPTRYGLIFERFLNPERVSMPDIDTDFDFERRPEVIEYVKKKYGEENVCNIITFDTLGAKNAVRDVARVLGDYKLGDEIAKMINANNLHDALEDPVLKKAYSIRSEIRNVIDIAVRIEGIPRNTSVNACGVVISDKPIKNYMPMAMVKDSRAEEKGLPKDSKLLCSQVTKEEVEELGCLKMDFLGLRTMAILRKCLETVNKERCGTGLDEIKSYTDLPLNDPYVYAEISKGNTQALFQIESEGMRSLMRSLFRDVREKIRKIEDAYQLKGFSTLSGTGKDKKGFLGAMRGFGEELFERMIAAISLYRPGPMDFIPDYIRGLNDPSSITYDTPLLEPILKSTYGTMVYQEQVMQTVKDLAGFTDAQADTIRKAMGKKKQEILDEYEPYFLYGSGDAVDTHTGKLLNIKGCVASGISEKTAKAVWDKMKDFAKYAFNKSHAAGYAVITVTSAWLKYYYPAHYICAALNSYIDQNNKLSAYLNVAGKMGIRILPPSINSSLEEFSLERDGIRFGLKGVKGLDKSVAEIIVNRNSYGPFTSVEDYMERIPGASNVDNLVKAGCFDEFGYTRHGLFESISSIKANIKRKSKEIQGQMSMFEELGIKDEATISDAEEWDKATLLQFEKEVTGLYISEHPLDQYMEVLENCSEISGLEEAGKVSIGCIITDYTIKYTQKDNRPMASLSLEDKTGDIKGILFPDNYENMFGKLLKDRPVVVKGIYQTDADYGRQIVIKSITEVEDMISKSDVSEIFVKVESLCQLDELESIISDYEGNIEVTAQCDDKLFKMKYHANACSALYMSLCNSFAGVIYK